MELSYAGPCSYRDGLDRLCRCDLYVYRDEDAAVVVASEREDNPGASITNTYEDLATGVWQKFGLRVDQVTLIEHYGAQAYGVRIDETFDAQFIPDCSSSKWSKHVTNSPFLARLATAGSNAAYKIISACSNAVS